LVWIASAGAAGSHALAWDELRASEVSTGALLQCATKGSDGCEITHRAQRTLKAMNLAADRGLSP
jgi:hypothetical protein